MAYLKAFNNQILKLAKELSTLYPENSDLKSLKNTLFLTIRTTPKLPIQVYRTHIYTPYNDEILSENESFFLDLDLTGTTLQKLEYVKSVWKEASEENRNIIWKYLKVLNKLIERHFQ